MAEITEAIPLWGQPTVDVFILLGEINGFSICGFLPSIVKKNILIDVTSNGTQRPNLQDYNQITVVISRVTLHLGYVWC